MVSNVFNKLHVVVCNPDMIKEMTSPDKLMIMNKLPSNYECFSSVFRNGLLFLEREDWKQHRKIISKVFNYDFIVSEIPTMITVADKVFD
jgi:cytochrome P450